MLKHAAERPVYTCGFTVHRHRALRSFLFALLIDCKSAAGTSVSSAGGDVWRPCCQGTRASFDFCLQFECVLGSAIHERRGEGEGLRWHCSSLRRLTGVLQNATPTLPPKGYPRALICTAIQQPRPVVNVICSSTMLRLGG